MQQELIYRKKTEHRAQVRTVKFIDLACLTAVFGLTWFYYYLPHFLSPISNGRLASTAVVLLYMVLYYSISHLYGSYRIHLSRISELVYSQILSAIITDFLAYVIIVLMNRHLMNVGPMFLALVGQAVVSVIWCILAHRWYFSKFSPFRTVIIWDERPNLDKLVEQYGMQSHFNIIATYRVEDAVQRIPEVLKDAECVFLCDIHSHERNQIIKYCVGKGINAYVLPRLGDMIMAGAEKLHLFHLSTLLVARYNPTPEYLVLKRFFDILLSAIALVILSPLMIVLSIIIKTTDGGTVLYKQTRLTKDGKEFKVLKFRSMRMDAEKDGVARLSSGEKDPRITPIGRVIRACRFDELPQLINILKGDMSIVGPRPERPEIAKQYEKELPEWPLRLQCKCGLTGYAQVYGQYNTTPYDKLMMDLTYIAKPSLAQDFKICLATVKILFLKESTEGVAEGQTTASFQKPERSVKEETDVQTQHIAEEAEQKHNI